MADEEKTRTEALVDSAALKILGRISGPLMILLGIWILNTVSDTKSLVASLSAQLGGIDTRVKTIEDWRNILDANASEPPKHR